MQLEMLRGGAVLLLVEHQIGAALAIEVHGLRPMPAGVTEAERAHEAREGLACGLVDSELQELDAGQRGRRRQAGAVSRHRFDVDERAQPVARRHPGRGGAEVVIENLQRQRPVVAGGEDRAHEAGHVQVALAGKVAEMAAPGQDIHVEPRRIGQLHEEDLVARHLGEAGRVVPKRQRVEAVHDQPERRMIDLAHDVPGLPPQRHVAAKGERLVADAQAAPRRRARRLPQGPPRPAQESSIAAGCMLLHTSTRSVPSACMTSNLRSARSRLRVRCGSGMHSKSRSGW